MAEISRPSQVTGWPIRANSHDGQPSRASTAIATAIAPAKPTHASCPAPVAQSEGRSASPRPPDFGFVFGRDW